MRTPALAARSKQRAASSPAAKTGDGCHVQELRAQQTDHGPMAPPQPRRPSSGASLAARLRICSASGVHARVSGAFGSIRTCVRLSPADRELACAPSELAASRAATGRWMRWKCAGAGSGRFSTSTTHPGCPTRRFIAAPRGPRSLLEAQARLCSFRAPTGGATRSRKGRPLHAFDRRAPRRRGQQRTLEAA